jgi:SagB-type dehydrogenase family enzyme
MPPRKQPLFRRSPFVVAYWRRGRLLFHNFATGAVLAADPLAAEILTAFDDWQPAESLAAFNARFSEYTPASLRATVHQLARHTFLERSDRPQDPKSLAMQSWRRWSPAAGFFHFSTKDTHFLTKPRDIARFFQAQLRSERVPTVAKSYPKASRINLPAAQAAGEFPQTLLARRTWRDFASGAVSAEKLATLLSFTSGVQHWLRIPRIGRAPLKVSPSGGARHPIETYVLALNVEGLPRGIYHYNSVAHHLECLRRGATRSEVTRILPGQWWYESAAALFLFTAVFPRTQWKYHAPRAYRAVLIEAGHVCQTFLLTATWLGLAPFCTMALADSYAEKILGVDGITESIIYVAGVGIRPPGKKSARWPEKMRRSEPELD